ncbi:hypothetical protein A4X13_0g5325 [Tilletia indica]|uniref:Uncharacterized protein n=1 Tax=Tilletia indica TaxID=43049 RepID=A0A177T7C9_9BASI|nr:hypothetical protein A4X13_0g5325 [Tilletia indica]
MTPSLMNRFSSREERHYVRTYSRVAPFYGFTYALISSMASISPTYFVVTDLQIQFAAANRHNRTRLWTVV